MLFTKCPLIQNEDNRIIVFNTKIYSFTSWPSWEDWDLPKGPSLLDLDPVLVELAFEVEPAFEIAVTLPEAAADWLAGAAADWLAGAVVGQLAVKIVLAD